MKSFFFVSIHQTPRNEVKERGPGGEMGAGGGGGGKGRGILESRCASRLFITLLFRLSSKPLEL